MVTILLCLWSYLVSPVNTTLMALNNLFSSPYLDIGLWGYRHMTLPTFWYAIWSTFIFNWKLIFHFLSHQWSISWASHVSWYTSEGMCIFSLSFCCNCVRALYQVRICLYSLTKILSFLVRKMEWSGWNSIFY